MPKPTKPVASKQAPLQCSDACMHAQVLQTAQLPEPARVHAVCPFASEFAVKSGAFEAVLLLVNEASQQTKSVLRVCVCLFECLLLLCFVLS